MAKFAVNNKIYSVTKISLFMANYGRKLRIEADIKRKDTGVCRKYEESSGKSQSSIKKGAGRDEATSRQKEKEG